MVIMSEFDEWFRRVRKLMEEMDKMFEEMVRGSLAFEGRGGRRVIGPYYYGFSVEIGPDGVPKVREWGNIKPGRIKPVITETIEPFTDIFDEGDRYRIIVDIPGVDKDQINIEGSEHSIIVSTEGERKYYKEIRLEDAIDPNTAKAQYKNGVLTITVEKKEKKRREPTTKIKIE